MSARETPGDLVVGSKIKFVGEAQRYTVQARSKRYAICTKPFNARRTVLYTIIDFDQQVRGRDNLIFGRGYETRAACEANLAEMEREDCPVTVSHRHCGSLDIEAIEPPRAAGSGG